MHKVYFFDIDGTLLHAAGAGQSAMEAVLLEEFGRELSELLNIPSAGRTDRAIAQDLLQRFALPDHEEGHKRFHDAYISRLAKALVHKQGTVLPGISQILEHLQQRASSAIGLLTGNYKRGAAAKLAHFGLEHYFKFGGYGDRHLHRNDVAREALHQAAVYLKYEVDPAQVWVIGDTPADIECARAIGANVIAVCTGMYKYAELAAEQPDYLVETMEETGQILQWLA